MSYEGYSQKLCAKGHLSTVDAHDDMPVVCRCGADMVWEYAVDETNGEGRPIKLIVKTREKTEACPCCGATKIIEEVTYRIPKNVGWRPAMLKKPKA